MIPMKNNNKNNESSSQTDYIYRDNPDPCLYFILFFLQA